MESTKTNVMGQNEASSEINIELTETTFFNQIFISGKIHPKTVLHETYTAIKGRALPKTNEIVTHICSCHNFSPFLMCK